VRCCWQQCIVAESNPVDIPVHKKPHFFGGSARIYILVGKLDDDDIDHIDIRFAQDLFPVELRAACDEQLAKRERVPEQCSAC